MTLRRRERRSDTDRRTRHVVAGAVALTVAVAAPAIGPLALVRQLGGLDQLPDLGRVGLGGLIEPTPALAASSPQAGPARVTTIDPADELLAFGGPVAPGSTRGLDLRSPVVGVAPSSRGTGALVAAADGGIFAFGDARFAGSMGGTRLNKPIVGVAATPGGGGYWLVASDGGIFAFGDAAFHGSTGGLPLQKPIVGMAATPSGAGYWLVASDGGIFAFGDAKFDGSMGGTPLNKPVVGMATTPGGGGYWLVASDGGIFAFGEATFHGSTGGLQLQQPIAGIAPAADGQGYRLAARDGGVFAFGTADFRGGAAQDRLLGDVVAIVPVAPVPTTPPGPADDTAGGYWMLVRRDRLPVPAPAAWVMVEEGSGATIVGSGIDERRRPASTSKMLTALVAVRRLPPDARFPISARAAAATGSRAGAKEGEVWGMQDALNGLLLPSGNDIAVAVAERVAGSLEAFAPVMQEVARELGVGGTWNDPAGLDGPKAVRGGNVATPKELADLARAMLAEPRLAAIVDQHAYTYSGTLGIPNTVTNSNRLVRTDPTVFGVKTGTTEAAGPSVVIAAERRRRRVVVVVLGAVADRFDTAQHILDDTPTPPRALSH